MSMRLGNRTLLSKLLVVFGWMGVFIMVFHAVSVFNSGRPVVTVQSSPAPSSSVHSHTDSQSQASLPVHSHASDQQQPVQEKPAIQKIQRADHPHHDHEHEYATRPFDPASPKFVILLAYQRVGSTFIGEMFNKHPGVAYTYEPLDSAYVHMYGTKEGWAVPMDLHFFWNGTYRAVPSKEKDIVADHLEKMLRCDFDDIMTEFLIHRFWLMFGRYQSVYAPYGACLKAKAKEVSLSKCQMHLQRTCKARVGQDVAKQEYCFRQLTSGDPGGMDPGFVAYRSCLEAARMRIQKDCLPKLTNLCSDKQVRALKTVRLDMETIEALVERMPNLRVIHLIRDPRPVVLSRMKTSWATLGSTDAKKSQGLIKNRPAPAAPPRAGTREDLLRRARPAPRVIVGRRRLLGAAANETSEESGIDAEEEMEKEMEKAEKPPNDFAKEAKLYCDLVRRDMRARWRIEAKHRGTTYQMIYEHMVYHPLHEVERVYDFLGEKPPLSVLRWANGTYAGAKNSREIAQKWQDQMTVKTAKQIDSFCRELYEEIEFAWPDSE